MDTPNSLDSRVANVRDRTMLKRFPITLLLGVALLFSQGGVVLVAALCPHLRFVAPICHMTKMEPAMDHHGMNHDTPLLPATSGNVIGNGEQPCSHCVIHSRSNSNFAVVRTANIGKRPADLEMPRAVMALPGIAPVDLALLTPREHGPPGARSNRPKHVLISTFRI